MKSKIILNILIVYFFILCFILIVQILSKNTNAVEPLPTEITYEDKLKNSVVLAINSPVTIINEKQYLIDESDSTLVPLIIDGKVYIPAKFLQTAYGANISFSKDTKETIVRLDNKAIVFSNNGTSIEIIDNTSEETIETSEEARIINDRFYVSLRNFADIFDKEVFYNNDLIIISNIKNIYDPIEEMNTLIEIENQVKQLPIIGNSENLKNIFNKAVNSYEPSNENDLLNIENLPTLLEEGKPVIVKKTNNYNIYVSQGFIEVYFVTQDNQEIFSFRIEKDSNKIEDIQITDNRFIISYNNDSIKTYIYDITDRNNIKTVEVIENNGVFYKNIISGNNLYMVSNIILETNKNITPIFTEYSYNDNELISITDKNINLNEIMYFPDLNSNVYTLISYINLYETESEISTGVYFGMGSNFVIDDDLIYIITYNGDNNNLYQFKATLDDIEYVQRVFINGNFKSISIDEEKQFIKVDLEEKTICYDNSLTER